MRQENMQVRQYRRVYCGEKSFFAKVYMQMQRLIFTRQYTADTHCSQLRRLQV